MNKSIPKNPKVLTFGKVSQKIPKSGGRGESDLLWTNSKLKLHFFLGGEAPSGGKIKIFAIRKRTVKLDLNSEFV